MEDMVLGERLLLSRHRADIDQRQLARLSGVSATYISKIERGHARNVTVDVVYKLAAGLGLSAGFLLGLTDVPTDDGAPIDAGSSHLTFDVRDPELRAILIEIADLVHGMTPAQRRYFVEQGQRLMRLMEEEENRGRNPIIIG